MLLPRNGFRATELVIEQETGGYVGPFPPPLGHWVEKWQRLDQGRGQRGQRQLTLEERLTDPSEFQLLEKPHPAVKHLGGPARRAGGKVAGFNQCDFQPSGGGVQSGSGTHPTAAYDYDV